jgi:hypothetical protein
VKGRYRRARTLCCLPTRAACQFRGHRTHLKSSWASCLACALEWLVSKTQLPITTPFRRPGRSRRAILKLTFVRVGGGEVGLGASRLPRPLFARRSIFQGERHERASDFTFSDFLLIVSPTLAEISVDSGPRPRSGVDSIAHNQVREKSE